MNKAQKWSQLWYQADKLWQYWVPLAFVNWLQSIVIWFLFEYNGELCSVADLWGEFPQYVWLQLCPSDREEREKTRLGDRAIAAAINGGVRLSDRGKSEEINNLLYCFSHNGLCIYITCYYVFCLYEVFLCVIGQERGGGSHLHLYLTLAGKTHNLLLCILIITERFCEDSKMNYLVLVNLGIQFFFLNQKKNKPQNNLLIKSIINLTILWTKKLKYPYTN